VPGSAARSTMKSPAELAAKLARQWQSADNREQRLLSGEAWPLSVPIGKPDAATFMEHSSRVRQHLDLWRGVTVGKVGWEAIRFRSASEAVQMPVRWILHNPSEWIAAVGDQAIQHEYRRLDRLASKIDPQFHRLLIRQRHLWLDKADAEVIRAAEVALALSPRCAKGKPLRALPVAGADSKFLERHRGLMIQLLDVRFEGQVSDLGLEAFLDALDENDHWLLLAPLGPNLLPFSQQRVRASELMSTPLAASNVLVVENERCLHQLPILPDTISILGAGLNLGWMQADWLRDKRLGYWGDMDTWGLRMLAMARRHQPHLLPLLMTREVFDAYAAALAVAEPSPSDEQSPEGLSRQEKEFYLYLRSLDRGRLEQEFLPEHLVVSALSCWRQST
jgi:hypothetical protein